MGEVTEEIKVGEYVRTEYTGITKIIKKVYFEGTNKIRYYFDDKNYSIFPDLIKPNHSKNIIDLIEVGDYVNGEKIIDIQREYYDINLDKVLPLKTPKIIVGNEEGILSVDKILSIVTKEQFSQMEYRLEE